jgi:hypothetical protein
MYRIADKLFFRARDCSGNPFLPLCGKKDWSGKPGFCALRRAKMRPLPDWKKANANALCRTALSLTNARRFHKMKYL